MQPLSDASLNVVNRLVESNTRRRNPKTYGRVKPMSSSYDPTMGNENPDARAGGQHPAGSEPEMDWRAWVERHADLLRAFESDTFAAEDDDAGLSRPAAGALIFASTYLIDELFQDIRTLIEKGGTVADSDRLFVLEDLPKNFARHYDARFAHKFLVATVTITGRLSAEQWAPPASVAEALALRLVIERAKFLLVDHEIVTKEQAGNLYADFEDAAFDDTDHELFYSPRADGFENDEGLSAQLGFADMRIESWFREFDGSLVSVHPFTVEVDEREPR